EHVTDAPDGPDEGRLAVVAELPPQPADQHVYAAVRGTGDARPRHFEQGLAGDHALRVVEKADQQVELGAGYGDDRAGRRAQLAAREIDRPSREPKQLRPERPVLAGADAAPQDGA